MERRIVLSDVDADVFKPSQGEKFIAGYLHHHEDGDDVNLRMLLLSQAELIQLLKMWVAEALDWDFWFFAYRQYGASHMQKCDFAHVRWALIENLLPKDVAKKAVEEAYTDFKTGSELSDKDWEVFLHGDDVQRQELHLKLIKDLENSRLANDSTNNPLARDAETKKSNERGKIEEDEF